MKLAAVADAPPTIDAMVKAAYDKAAIYFPFVDFIVADPCQELCSGCRQWRAPKPRPERIAAAQTRGQSRHGPTRHSTPRNVGEPPSEDGRRPCLVLVTDRGETA
jgi:hypothetical protein